MKPLLPLALVVPALATAALLPAGAAGWSSSRGPSVAGAFAGVSAGAPASLAGAGPGRATAPPGSAALVDPADALSVFAPPLFVPAPAPDPVFLRPPVAGTPRGVAASSVAAPSSTWTWPLAPRPEVRRRFLPPAHTWSPGHRGVDLAAAVGQPVLAAGAGTVSFSGVVAGRGVVTVRHAGGLRTTYEPVDGRAAVGTTVRRGDRVGTLSAAPGHCQPLRCLHWGAVSGDTYRDPLALLDPGHPVLLPLR
jgi:murein DD-endopeptidase MepM/ murein hydrolase activator NlpD